MIFIKNLIKITDEKYSIGFIHYMPFDKEKGYKINRNIATREQLEQEGVLIDVTQEELNKHRDNTMYYNPLKNEILWEENTKKIDIDKKEQNETFAKTLAQLTIDNKQKDTVIKNLSQTVAKISIDLNKLKGSVE